MNRRDKIKQVIMDFYQVADEQKVILIEEEDVDLLSEAINDVIERD